MDINYICLIFNRIKRILIGKKGIYGKYGKNNRFCEGVLIYENAQIGSYNYFSPYAMVNNAQIGNYNSIGPGSKIGLGEHDYTCLSTYPSIGNGKSNMQIFDIERPTIIENDVWLGSNVVIKQGVKVCNGAVVGANSVVTKNVPPYAIVVGAPAKLVKYRFDKVKIDYLMLTNWYAKDFVEARHLLSGIKED